MRMIGRYKVCGRLGKGGMGSVYKVKLPGLERIVALKLLDPAEIMVDLLGMDELKRQFMYEARIMAGLNHPHIAGIWDLDETDSGLPYFIMEYSCNNLGTLTGESYMVEEPTRRLTVDTAVKYAIQTLSGLNRMHHEGVIHRDIKPYNLLITADDSIKIIDFGLSKLRGEDEFGAPPGMKVGSPYYAAPEQEMDPKSADARADIYAVGVTLFRMLTGLLPYDEESGEAMRLAKAHNPELDWAWQEFFAKALALDPADRHETCAEMIAELEYLEEDWEDRRDRICSLPDADEDIQRLEDTLDRNPGLRDVPVKTGPVTPDQAFFLDRLGRPKEYYRCAFKAEADQTVRDEAHGLMWQAKGSPYPLTWQRAREYVDQLNEVGFAGYDDWRIPTVEELMTLIREAPELGDFCVDSLFDPQARQVWSCDRRTFIQSWCMDGAMGFIGFHDHTCPLWVRAVRSDH
ncbi:MAG: DUF1566 domain-containing protein [Desulfovibrio sp.]|nr:MAG: DUF1566 domain-containing protein [Desulfovibrio sp.]